MNQARSDWPAPPAPPVPSPVRARGGGLGAAIAVALAVAIVAFGAGYQLGVGPAPTPAPRPSPSPSPPDLQPGFVSDRLQLAYRAAGGRWTICVLDAAPTCTPVNHELYGLLVDPREVRPALTSPDWEALGPRTVHGSRLVLVADLHADATLAFLAAPGTGGVDAAPAETRLSPISDGAGIFYFALGSLAPGRYALLVGASQTFVRSSFGQEPFRASAAPSGWWTDMAAFEVA